MLCCYKLAKFFFISSFCKYTFNYIERWFTSVVETESFLELEFSDLLKILKSSGLLITSELEVYDAAEKWIGGDIMERKMFAIDLLLVVRLPLLSDLTLRKLLKTPSSFTKLKKCNILLREISENKKLLYKNMSSSYTTTRYCNQEFMNILVCGGPQLCSDMPLRTINRVDVSNNFEVNGFCSMLEGRYAHKVVCLKGDIYVFWGHSPLERCMRSVARYSLIVKCWNEVAETPGFLQKYLPDSFCACGFIDKVFIFGGYQYHTCCLQFDTINCDFEKLAGMIEPREHAACAVFEEKLVVSGGLDNFNNRLNTVECYDVTGYTWTRMPSMTKARSDHSLMVVRNKLFAIGSGSNACEVYTTNTGKFVALKSPELTYNKSLQVAGKIFVFQDNKTYVWVYDVEGEVWSKEDCDATKYIVSFSCAKIPIY